MLYLLLGIIILALGILSILQTIKFRELQSKYNILEDEFLKLTIIKVEKPVEVQKIFPESPICQFCKNKLNGYVKRRPDGYWCCQSCSVKVFHTVAQ